MSENKAINDILQGTVVTYLRCGGIVSNQIKKGLLLRLPVFFFKSVNIWPRYKQEGRCLVHFVYLLKDEQTALTSVLGATRTLSYLRVFVEIQNMDNKIK